jgi:hypothetical protein
MNNTILLTETNKMIQTFTTILKTKLLALATIIITFFTPVIPFVITTFFFIVFDTIMGFLKVKYVAGEKRNSNGFKRGFIPKVIIYTLVLFIVFMADRLIRSEAVKHYTQFDYVITKIVALILIFIETLNGEKKRTHTYFKI